MGAGTTRNIWHQLSVYKQQHVHITVAMVTAPPLPESCPLARVNMSQKSSAITGSRPLNVPNGMNGTAVPGEAASKRLAVCSKPLNHLVQGASCWKHLFEEAVRAAGKGYTRPGDSCQLDYMGLVGISWSGEKHLLSAFTDLGIAQAAGFKKAVKCLCVHTCEVCQASLFIHMICPI